MPAHHSMSVFFIPSHSQPMLCSSCAETHRPTSKDSEGREDGPVFSSTAPYRRVTFGDAVGPAKLEIPGEVRYVFASYLLCLCHIREQVLALETQMCSATLVSLLKSTTSFDALTCRKRASLQSNGAPHLQASHQKRKGKCERAEWC